MRTIAVLFTTLAVLFTASVVAAEQSATPVPVAELKSLAGTWRGAQTDRWGAGEVEWTIEDSRFKAVVTNPVRGTYRAEGNLFITKGQVVWRGKGSTGTVTLYELSGRRMIKLDGLGIQSNRPVSGELYKVE